VLDAFDEWRRAIGVAQEQQDQAPATRSKASLATHIEQVVARLTTLRASAQRTRVIDTTLEQVARELDQLLPGAKGARGATREQLVTRLADLDSLLGRAALEAVDAGIRAEAVTAATEQLAPFRERMSRAAYDRACAAAVERQVREHLGLPDIAFT
jgi:hypothetical protein